MKAARILIAAAVILAVCSSAWAAPQQWQLRITKETCSHGHDFIAHQWDDHGIGGAFSDPTAAEPTYTAPPNTTGAEIQAALNCTATCAGDPENGIPQGTVSASASITITPIPHTLELEVTAEPIMVAAGDPSQLHAEAKDALGPVSWEWSDGGQGVFDPSPRVSSPLYWPTAPGRIPVRLNGTLESPYPVTEEAGLVLLSLSADGSAFTDVSADHWAYPEIMDVYWRGIVNGYGDGTYQPDWEVTRDQMAVYLSRSFRYLGAPDPTE